MKVRFHIEKRRGAEGTLLRKDRPVFMVISFNGNRIGMSTGIKTDMEWWDPVRQRVREEHRDSVVLNLKLDSLEKTAFATWNAMASLSGDPGITEFRNLFRKLSPGVSMSFFDLFYQYMREAGQKWKYSTYNSVRTIYKQLREFEVVNDYPLSFNRIDRKFLDLFVEFYRDKGNSRNTTIKAVNILVMFLNWSADKGYNIFKDFREFKSILGEQDFSESKKIFLSKDALLKIESFSTTDRKVQRIRDLFCLMCYTGLKYSELQNLKKEDIVRDRIIVQPDHKRNRSIPLDNRSRRVLKEFENRYFRNGKAFPQMSISTFNKYLRMLCEQAGIYKTINDSGALPKCREITVGVARNTFLAHTMMSEFSARGYSESDQTERGMFEEVVRGEFENTGYLYQKVQ
ncbi:MAG: site-specific integrase [Bacteroidales bacterium]|nr:site-specific integrase [Bacteroidales bacterium]